jgi:hypothetical protein
MRQRGRDAFLDAVDNTARSSDGNLNVSMKSGARVGP